MVIFLYFAFVFFVIGTFTGVGQPGPLYLRFNLISAGLACWVASLIFK
jgi:hypothetical protein